MKIMLIGKSGQLGKELCAVLARNGHELITPSREELDLARPAMAAAFVHEARPECVINTAAFHSTVLCEQEKDLAHTINAHAVKALAMASAKIQAKFITFSTDYVFDGLKGAPYLEHDRACPLQVYGESKLEGENLARAANPKGSYVIRTCGVFGARASRPSSSQFFEEKILTATQPFEAGNDQIISPTHASDLAEAITRLLLLGPAWMPGIYHLTNEGKCTWLEFAQEALRLLGRNIEVRAHSWLARSPRRPAYSALANTKAAALGVKLPPWQLGLARFLEASRPRA